MGNYCNAKHYDGGSERYKPWYHYHPTSTKCYKAFRERRKSIVGSDKITKHRSFGISQCASYGDAAITYRNIDILTHADKTSYVKNGFFLDGDLRIKDFIYDNATIAAGGTVAFAGGAGKSWERPIFNVFTEEILTDPLIFRRP